MPSFSNSSLGAFEQCPKQYDFRYVQKVRPPEPVSEAIELFVGSRVHESLEALYQALDAGRVWDERELIESFRAKWDASYGSHITISRPDKTLADYKALGEFCLSAYHRRRHPFDSEKTLGIELAVSYPLDTVSDIRIKGYIDRLAITPQGVYEIHDYKTAARLPDRSRLDSDRQLALYQLGVQQMYPEAVPSRVKLVWHYLAHDQRLESSRTPNQLADLATKTLSLAQTILATRDYPARVGRHCDFCDFRPICPEYSKRPA